MILYLDTSALVKLFADEPGAPAVRSALAGGDGHFTHLITYAETRATFAKALRVGWQTPERLLEHKRDFERLWNSLDIVAVDEPLIRRAGDLAEQLDLRGYDSVHLAAAELVWRQARDAFGFSTFDRHLRDAGQMMGMEVLEHD